MKKTNLLAALGLSLVGLGLTAAPTHAASYANNDLLVAFYATGGEGSTTSVVLDIGPASTYRNAAGEIFLGSIGTDLVNAFGADWFTRGDVFWGVFGSTYSAAADGDAAWTLYAGRAQTTIGTQATGFSRGSVATQSQPGTRIHDLGDAYALTGSASGLTVGVNPAASIQDSSADNDFAEYQSNAGGTSFGYFQSALANFAGGAASSAVDLFRMTTQDGAITNAGDYEGTFTVGSNGVVRFSTVPNPSPTPTPTPAPTATPTPEPGKTPAQIQKQIKSVKKQLKAAKKIDDAAKKKKKIKALKKKLKKLQQQLQSLS
jgi:hypothetical protein